MKKFSILILVVFCFGITTLRAQYNVLLNFNGTNGQWPNGSLTLSGNVLYGMTQQGGLNNDGCIFSIHTNGKGYKDLLDFNVTNGVNPFGSLTISGDKLYGMTTYMSNIFSIDTNGTGFKNIISLNGIASPYGANPYGALTISGGLLYGMTQLGGIYDDGCIFVIDTSGFYLDLHDFNDTIGEQPSGSLTLSGTILYGMTQFGGTYNNGIIFSINTNGTGFKDLLDFDSLNGQYPYGSLTIAGNVLYGMTSTGGANGWGNIFSIHTDGSSFRDLLDFGPSTGGEAPEGSLIISGKNLYGICGDVFSIDTNGSDYKVLCNFADSGAVSNGSLTLSGNTFFGMAEIGGVDGDGFIFSLDSTGCVNDYNQSICIVTTDTSINKNVIIWGRNDSPPNGFFNIYDSTTTGWNLIGSVSDTALSEYIDNASNPSTQAYSYRISTVDSCGQSALSPLNSTIYLQVLQEASGRDSLYWTPYVGFSTPYYLIYRGPSLNALTLIDSVSGSGAQYFVDTLPPAGSIYLVEAINPSGGCTPTKHFTKSSSANTYASISNGGVPKKVTGIANITYPKNAITISPNPNNGKFTIQSLVNGGALSVKIYNVFGQEVYSTPLPQTPKGTLNEINISAQPSGIYFYRVFTETGNLVSEGKFIKD
ncbi:MAG TPA: choice-of-anchor tandem repeat GloVer-containing protein [Bacteroidia bacterium]|jgi:uncharacterized repeat protein (TIGR03803 family)|nr:choice-of-anchor tandem repeat GloVer-containing protein [Bacteroidia bacterium]